jgi:precorrin-6B methylase 2
MMSQSGSTPTPEHLFKTLNAYQESAALKAAIELNLFTGIGEGNQTAQDLAAYCHADPRGIRILCDYLAIQGFLTKSGQEYGLSTDAAVFLDRRSPAYMGSVAEFIVRPEMVDSFDDLAGCVRKGGTLMPGKGSVETEYADWTIFARAMMPMMRMPAQQIAEIVECDPGQKYRLLDIAAGHGLFGIAFAQRYPHLEVFAVDWPQVLEVAKENAALAGVTDRYRTLPGDAFEVEFGEGYDLALLTNFLHHFDPPTCEALLRKVHAALKDGGRVATLEFVPNEDRISPPVPAAFSLIMLAATPSGDAYTYPELEAMFKNAGFSRSESRPLTASPQQVIVSYK